MGVSRVGILNPAFIKDFHVKDDDRSKPRMDASDHFDHAQASTWSLHTTQCRSAFQWVALTLFWCRVRIRRAPQGRAWWQWGAVVEGCQV